MPRAGVADFVPAVRRIVPARDGDLMNVTIRFVDTDTDTLLRYADGPLFALVMLFNQPTTAAVEARMRAMTQDLIDTDLNTGGRYCLPYRLHATVAQFHKACPQAARFFELKRTYDPDELFQNRSCIAYGVE